MIQLKAHAKLNLGLCLLGKREDGFHELETLMHEIDLADELELVPSETTTLSMNGVQWDEQEQGPNLILSAKRACEERLGKTFGEWDIKVTKNIPMGSGLGGGSSNAIALLNYLQTLNPEALNATMVDGIAASLGSDTNFFIHGGSAVCRGRGEKIDALPKRQFYFNLVFPKFSCSTPRVFSKVVPEFESALNWPEVWNSHFEGATRNDLEQACCLAYPKMNELLRDLRTSFPELCLSGSGSTLFTMCEDPQASNQMLERLNKLCEGRAQVLPAQSYLRAGT